MIDAGVSFGALLGLCCFLFWSRGGFNHNKLLLVVTSVYVLVPGLIMLWRPQTLFYDVGAGEMLPRVFNAFTLFGLSWMLGQAIGTRSTFGFSVHGSGGGWTKFAAWASLCVSVPINAILVTIGNASIEGARAAGGMSSLWAFKNVHLLGLLFFGSLLFSEEGNKRASYRGFAVAACVTVLVGILEGRRTAVVLPVVLYASGALMAGRFTSALRTKMVVLMFGAVFVTTAVRLLDRQALSVDPSVIADAVIGRIGAPIVAMDELLQPAFVVGQTFEPRTLHEVMVGITGGTFSGDFINHSVGNDFGYSVGLIDASETFTRINIGWVGELYAGFGWLGILIGGCLFGFTVGLIWRLFRNHSFLGIYVRMFLVIYVLSGFQLDIPHPFVRLVRAMLLGFFVCLASLMLARSGRLELVRDRVRA